MFQYARDSLTGLVNAITGTNTARDKITGGEWYFEPPQPEQLRNLFRASWMARKAVTIPAMDMLREGWTWSADANDVARIEAEEKRLKLVPKVREAMTLARLYGGAALVVGAGSLDPEQPLTASQIGRGGVRFLNALPWFHLSSGQIELDPMSPFYMQPVYYDITSTGRGGQRIHPSRVIRFIGEQIPANVGQLFDQWGDSCLTGTIGEINAATTGVQNIARMLQESTVSYYKIQGLLDALSSDEGTDRVVKLLQLTEQTKSSVNAVAMDAEGEGHEQFNAVFAGLPEVQQLLLQLISGGQDIPVTRFLGQSPGGMNATGESDTRNYYDMLSSRQETDLRPTLDSLWNLILPSALGARPDDINAEFNPLWQLDEKEQAANASTRATTLAIYQDKAILPDVVVQSLARNDLIENGAFPGAEKAFEEADAAGAAPRTEEVTAAVQGDAAPRTLYVSRPVTNAAELIAWAKGQGFKTTTPAHEMHVTIAFSRQKVDWMKMGADYEASLTIPEGGPRLVETLGPRAVVLLFASSHLSWRHEHMKREGAAWEHPEYQPHITLTYEPGDVDLTTVKPFTGKIELGPEFFDEVKESWSAGLTEA